MKSKIFKILKSLSVCLVVVANSQCCDKPECVETVAVQPRPTPPPSNPCGPETGELTALPPNAKRGECFAKVYIPATYKTVTERVLVSEASEKLEVVPAEYEWVEERVMIKDASAVLDVVPAEYAQRDRTMEVSPARSGWEVKKAEDCKVPNQATKDVFCLVDRPPVQKTVSEKYVSKPATVEEKTIPAEYSTVRRQRLVRAASVKRVPIPAQYADVERQVKVCDARIAWQRVACEDQGAMLDGDQLGNDAIASESGNRN